MNPRLFKAPWAAQRTPVTAFAGATKPPTGADLGTKNPRGATPTIVTGTSLSTTNVNHNRITGESAAKTRG